MLRRSLRVRVNKLWRYGESPVEFPEVPDPTLPIWHVVRGKKLFVTSSREYMYIAQAMIRDYDEGTTCYTLQAKSRLRTKRKMHGLVIESLVKFVDKTLFTQTEEEAWAGFLDLANNINPSK